MKRLFTLFALLAMFSVVGCEDKIQETPNENGGNEQEGQEPELPDVTPIENICEAMDDVEFIKYCNENFDINNDGILAESEIVNVRHIDISDKKIYSIEGIAYFENLNELNANGSSLINVDLRRNTNLTMVSFRECALLEGAMLPELSIIADSTFYACNRLAECKVSSSVTQIGNGAFQGCSAMTELSLSENVTSVGKYAFADCSGLETITMHATNIAECAFQGATVVLTIKPNTKLGKTEIGASAFANSSIRSATIVEGITSIGEGAFYNCTNLASVTIPEGVISIGNSAFHSCESLEGVIIPSSVTEIGGSAFYGCGNLSIVVPSTVTTIGANAFMGCANVTFADTTKSITYTASSKLSISASGVGANSIVSHTYNDGVGIITFDTAPTIIGNNTFNNNTSLTNITIPNSVTEIGSQAFDSCSNLTSITIPDSVTSIGERAFYGCSSLASIAIPNSVTEIGSQVFYDCSNLINITIPDSVTSIGERAFYGCSSLTSIAIPNSVTEIGSQAFDSCSNLTSITIPDGVTLIEEYTFNECTNLASVTISESVAQIGKYAFDECPLKEVYCKPTTPPAIYFHWWNENSYGGIFTTYDILKIYVPRNSYDEYTQYTSRMDNVHSQWNWSIYNDFIEPYDFE